MSHIILHLDSSSAGSQSVTKQLAEKLINKLQSTNNNTQVIHHDFGAKPLPHLSGEMLTGFFTPEDERSANLKELVKLSDNAIAEVMKADTIIIGAPMYNFGVPSALKAWIDHVVRAGKTFAYNENGIPGGLVPAGKKVFIISARGGIYSEGAMQSMDFQESYLKAVLGFIGLHDVSFIRAEGVAMGAEMREGAIHSAEEQIQKIA